MDRYLSSERIEEARFTVSQRFGEGWSGLDADEVVVALSRARRPHPCQANRGDFRVNMGTVAGATRDGPWTREAKMDGKGNPRGT